MITNQQVIPTETQAENNGQNNPLFPVFLKLEQLHVLLVGAGNVGLEKLHALLHNAPQTRITIVAGRVLNELRVFAADYPAVHIIERDFEPADLEGKDVVVIAIDNSETSAVIRRLAKDKRLLANVADTPELCDFYLGSIVQKGDLKIAISTNGKSPTAAKRLREVLNDALPAQLNDVINNLHTIRQRLNGDFQHKVQQLNDITKVLVETPAAVTEAPAAALKQPPHKPPLWIRIVRVCVFAVICMIVGAVIFSYIPAAWILNAKVYVARYGGDNFLWMLGAGFLAQLVDGAMGMGYGVLSTTLLMSAGVRLASISSSVHMAEMFSVGATGISHYRYGNVNKKLLKALAIPGAIGAICGAVVISTIGDKYAHWLRPLVSVYTFYLGFRIIAKAFAKRKKQKKITRVGPVAMLGGFLDAFGGGWGPLVTSTLISRGRNPQYTIGTSTLTKFFTSIASTTTFIVIMHETPVQVIAGLILGGLIAAPIAAKLVGKLPLKTMFICVGTLVIICSLRILFKAFF
ncbi:TSUP family transporter [Deminuibacter soli]|uniref:Probable membrane transporter protein n=1 Tax=Deminuibacter soli TaxID=2291815 RepID=A0A3E1NNC2_9BACT|nr:TSUP family transporter [Deminuibacter soli]RFM29420.1 ABC transporter permease [Deminuibacter soli]